LSAAKTYAVVFTYTYPTPNKVLASKGLRT
jgi:hypothetical protein